MIEPLTLTSPKGADSINAQETFSSRNPMNYQTLNLMETTSEIASL